MSIKLTIHSTGEGTCSLSAKEGAEGLTVSFDDGTVQSQFLSTKAFLQLIRMKTGAKPASPKPPVPGVTPLLPSPAPVAAAVPAANGAK